MSAKESSTDDRKLYGMPAGHWEGAAFIPDANYAGNSGSMPSGHWSGAAYVPAANYGYPGADGFANLPRNLGYWEGAAYVPNPEEGYNGSIGDLPRALKDSVDA